MWTFLENIPLVFWRVNDQLDVLNCPFIVRVCVNSGVEMNFSYDKQSNR